MSTPACKLKILAVLSVSLCSAVYAQAPPVTSEPTPETATASVPAEPAQTAPTEPEVAPLPDAKALTAEILAPPTTDAAIEQRIAEVKEKLKALVPTTQPTTGPAPGDPGVAQTSAQLFEAVSSYLVELMRWKAARERIRDLGDREKIAQASKELAEWRELTQALREKAAPRWRFQIEPEMEKVEQDLTKWKALSTPLKSLQTGRESQMTALPAKKQQSESAVQSTQQELDAYLKSLSSELDKAETQNQRVVLNLRKQVLEWKHNLALLRAEMLSDERTVLELEVQQDADRITASNAVLTALYEYRSRLSAQKSKSDSEYAAEQLQRDDLLPYERAYWEVVSASARGMTLFQQYSQTLYRRYPAADHARLQRHISNADLYWQRFVQSVDRRPGQALEDAYQKLREQLRDYRHQLEDMQRKLDTTLEEQRNMLEIREEVTEAVAAGQQKLESIISQLKDDQLTTARTRQTQLISETVNKLTERMESAFEGQDALIVRLTNSIDMLQKHIDTLARHRSQVYWAHLVVPSRGILRQDWGNVRTEVRWLLRREGPLEAQWDHARARTRATVIGVGAPSWISIFIIVALSAWVGVRARRQFRCRCADLLLASSSDSEISSAQGADADQSAEAQAERARLVQYQLWRVAATSAPLAWPCIGLLAAIFLFKVLGAPWRLLTIASLATLITVMTLVSLRALFDSRNPQARIIPCSDEIARYHRRWLRAILIVAAATLPISLALEVMETLPAVAGLIWDTGKIVLLVQGFLYTVRRRKFTPQSSAVDYGWEASLYTRIFPIFPASFALMIALEVGGYGALTDYLLRGLFFTLVILGTAKLLRSSIEAWVQVQQSAAAPLTTSQEAGALRQVKIHPLLASGLHILRLLLLFGAPVLVLLGWGVSAVEMNAALNYRLITINDKPLTAWRIVAICLALGMAIAGSRALRTFLQTRVFPRAKQLDLGAQAAISTILHYAILGVACYVALNLAQLDLGAITVLLGTLGLGLGLGLQPLFVNFISGLMILFERHVRVGDLVEVNGQVGSVSSIQMRSTNIKTADGIELVVPNGDFVTGQVTNWTLSDRKLRARLPVGVAYGTDVETVRKLLLDIAHRHESVLTDPAPAVWFMDLAENSLNFELVCWFGSPETRWAFLSQVRFEVVRLFKEHDIEIPFPQRTISVLGNRPIPVEMVERRHRDLTGDGHTDTDILPGSDPNSSPHSGSTPRKEPAALWKQDSP